MVMALSINIYFSTFVFLAQYSNHNYLCMSFVIQHIYHSYVNISATYLCFIVH